MTGLAYPRVEEYGQQPAPSALKTAGLSAFKPFANSAYALNQASHWAIGTPLNEEMKSAVDLIDYQLANPEMGTGQQVTNAVAGIAGSVLDPVSLALGGFGGKLIGYGASKFTPLIPEALSAVSEGAISREAVSSLLSKEIPEFANNRFAKYLPKDFHDAFEKSAESAGIVAGFELPRSFTENYNANTNRLDYGGFAKSITINGGIGLAIPPLAWTGGVIGGRIFAKGEEATLSAAQKTTRVAKALEEGKITQQEHDLYVGMLHEPENVDKHYKNAMQILNKENHPVNAITGYIDLPFLTKEEMSQLQGFAVDQMAANLTEDYKGAMSNFIVHGQLDRLTQLLTEKPTMLNGIKSYVDEMSARLNKRVEQLEIEDKLIDHATPKVREEAPISQRDLFALMKKGGLREGELPFTVPKNISTHFNLLDKISKLEYKNKYNPNKQTVRRIEELKKQLPHIPTLNQELKELEHNLIGGEKLPDRYKVSNDYLRLLDLAEISPKARALVKKIAVRERYDQQAAYNEVLKGITQIAEGSIGKMANPDRVLNYLKERIEGSSDIQLTKKEMEDRVSEVEARAQTASEKVLTDVDAQFKEISEHPELSKDTKDEFNTLYSRIKQFKGSEKVLEDMVNCIMEAENVAV